jgi:hypothetical protein
MAFVFVAAVVGGICWIALRPPSVHGDSAVLVRGSAGIVDCLHHRRLTGCEGFVVHHPTGDSTVRVGPYPLLQYVPAVPLRALGVSIESTLRVLVLLNAVSLIAIIALAYRTLERLVPPIWAPLVTVTLLASPLLWYGKAAFGEELAAAAILAAVVAVLVDARMLIVAALVALACITKETNPPFVLALTAICTLARASARDPMRRQHLMAIAIGTATGITLNTGFNIFRFGTARNAVYLRSGLYAPNLGVIARLFAAQWLAPNGGLVWFWPLAPALIFTVAVVSWRRRRPMSWQRVAAPLVALLLIGQVTLLSAWWAPFGWYAWGPRLVLPLVPAMLVAACVLGTQDATATMVRFLRSPLLIPATALAIVIGLVQAVALFHGLAVTQFFSHPTCVGGSVLRDPTGYYRCLNQTAWSKQPWMLQLGMRGVNTAQGRFVAIAFVGAIVSLLCLARRAANEETTTLIGGSGLTR